MYYVLLAVVHDECVFFWTDFYHLNKLQRYLSHYVTPIKVFPSTESRQNISMLL
jgi:hypothetical protein